MIPVPEMVLSAYGLSRQQFAEKYPHPVFLATSAVESTEPQNWSFRTETISSASLSIGTLLAQRGLTVDKGASRYKTYELVKTKNNPWRDTITIGRARNNDVVLLDTSVSKLHAHFTVDADQVGHLEDVGSRNGTVLNGLRLVRDKPCALKSSDKLLFGRVELVYLDSGGFYDFLMTQLHRKQS